MVALVKSTEEVAEEGMVRILKELGNCASSGTNMRRACASAEKSHPMCGWPWGEFLACSNVVRFRTMPHPHRII